MHSVKDRTELSVIIRDVIRAEIGLAFDLKMQPIKQSLDSLQEIIKDTSSKLREERKRKQLQIMIIG